MEELASHGYVVFAPDHTYGAMVTAFQDGTVVMANTQLLPKGVPTDEYNRAALKLGEVWAGDLSFVLDQAARLDSGELPGPFQGRLDLAKVGLFGHSTGGGGAVAACFRDTRCQAGLAEDAWLVPYDRQIAAQGLNVPVMLLQSQDTLGSANVALVEPFYAHTRAPAWRLSIAGAEHFDFSDISLLTPLGSLLGIKGPIDGMTALRMFNAYTVAFFDQTLKGQPSPLLDGPAPAYPQVTFEKR
jgi:hypothetical protein